MQEEMMTLKMVRNKIDSIDQEIFKLLQKRAIEVLKIKKYKKLNSLSLTDKFREREILNQCSSSYEKNIFKTIIAASKKLQNANHPDRYLKKRGKFDRI